MERPITWLNIGEANADAKPIFVNPACATEVSATKSPTLSPMATSVRPRIAEIQKKERKNRVDEIESDKEWTRKNNTWPDWEWWGKENREQWIKEILAGIDTISPRLSRTATHSPASSWNQAKDPKTSNIGTILHKIQGTGPLEVVKKRNKQTKIKPRIRINTQIGKGIASETTKLNPPQPQKLNRHKRARPGKLSPRKIRQEGVNLRGVAAAVASSSSSWSTLLSGTVGNTRGWGDGRT